GFRLPTTFGNGASVDLSAALDLSRMLRGVFGDSARILSVLDRITQLDMGRRIDRRSQFDRAGFDPGTSYLFGFGGTRSFLTQEGRLAIAASDARSDRASMSMRMPLGLTITGA